MGPGRGFPSLGVWQCRAVLPTSISPGRNTCVIPAAFLSPAQPFGGTSRVRCYCRVSSAQRCSGLSPAVPPSHHPNGGSPGLLPEEENHNLSAGAGRAPLQQGRQPSSLLAGPCRRLAAAPADLHGSRPCPRRSPGTRCPHSHPGHSHRASSGPQILHFYSDCVGFAVGWHQASALCVPSCSVLCSS